MTDLFKMVQHWLKKTIQTSAKKESEINSVFHTTSTASDPFVNFKVNSKFRTADPAVILYATVTSIMLPTASAGKKLFSQT